ncbi:hypothetical protein AB4520_11610 [Vibrio renipiscarius]|uniref:hypothetical protein n=1 Tax=Vibrio renipiscarius TaxID=1461322 RepID=UPI003553EF74
MKNSLIVVFFSLYLTGCSLFVSQDTFGEHWKGNNVDRLIEHWGEPEKTTVMSDGGLEVIYKIFSDTCTYTFYSDEQGIITSYKYESTTWGTCKPIG